jgi:hypothetical protein
MTQPNEGDQNRRLKRRCRQPFAASAIQQQLEAAFQLEEKVRRNLPRRRIVTFGFS